MDTWKANVGAVAAADVDTLPAEVVDVAADTLEANVDAVAAVMDTSAVVEAVAFVVAVVDTLEDIVSAAEEPNVDIVVADIAAASSGTEVPIVVLQVNDDASALVLLSFLLAKRSLVPMPSLEVVLVDVELVLVRNEDKFHEMPYVASILIPMSITDHKLSILLL